MEGVNKVLSFLGGIRHLQQLGTLAGVRCSSAVLKLRAQIHQNYLNIFSKEVMDNSCNSINNRLIGKESNVKENHS